jgi:hypothetical protein
MKTQRVFCEAETKFLNIITTIRVSGLKMIMKTKIHSTRSRQFHVVQYFMATTDTERKRDMLFAVTNWLQQKFVTVFNE